MSHLKLHFTLHTWQSSHSTLHTSHCTLHTALFALHTPHSSHFTLHPSQSTLHTSHSTLHTSHSTLHISHSTLHTALFLPHTSHCTLHLIWALLTLSQLSSSHLISSHMSSKLSWITSQYYYKGTCMILHAQCASQARACVLCAKLLQCCCPRTWPARVPGAMQREASTFLTHHIAPFTLHIWAHFIWFHVFPYVSYVLLGYFHVIWAQLKLSHALDLLSTYLGASAH